MPSWAGWVIVSVTAPCSSPDRWPSALSSLLAWGAPSLNWMYLVFILSGLANVAYWTIGMAITTEFGTEETRPTYIGLSNTLVAPFTIIAPLLGGWIADTAGFETTFMISAVGGLVIAGLLIWLVRDPRPRQVCPLNFVQYGKFDSP